MVFLFRSVAHRVLDLVELIVVREPPAPEEVSIGPGDEQRG